MINLFLALAFADIAVGAYVLCALSRTGWRAKLGPGLFAAVLLAINAASVLSLGYARPYWALTGDKWDILYYKLDEGRAIYVLVRGEGSEPMLAVLPWSIAGAEEMVRGAAEADDTGQGSELTFGDGLFDGEPQVNPVPPPPLPLKSGE